MLELPFQLRYTLSRSQRLIPHLRIWGVGYGPFVVIVLGFFCVQLGMAIAAWDWKGAAVFGALSVAVVLLCRGFFVGLLDVLLIRKREMDILVEEETAGIMMGGERWYIHLDGVTDIRKYRADTWTIRHFNGTVLNVPVWAISDEQLAHFAEGMERVRNGERSRATFGQAKRVEELGNGGWVSGDQAG